MSFQMNDFGNTNIEATPYGWGSNVWFGGRFQLLEDGTITSVKAYLHAYDVPSRVAIYDDTGKLIAISSNEKVISSADWYSYDFNLPLKAGYYILVVGSSGILEGYVNTAGGGEYYSGNLAYPVFNDPIGTQPNFNWLFSIYAEYYVGPPPPQHSLTIQATVGGTTNPVTGIHVYNEGTNVQVTAVPDTGYVFSYWELDGGNIGSANPVAVNMNTDHTLLVAFAEIPSIPKHTLTVDSTPINGIPLIIERVS